MTDFKRVYHPTLDSWQDVPAGDVEDWAEAGWRKTAPAHVTKEGLPPVGQHPGYATVPADAVVASQEEAPKAARARSGTQRSAGSGGSHSTSRSSGGTSSGRGAGSAGSSSTSGGTSTGSTT